MTLPKALKERVRVEARKPVTDDQIVEMLRREGWEEAPVRAAIRWDVRRLALWSVAFFAVSALNFFFMSPTSSNGILGRRLGLVGFGICLCGWSLHWLKAKRVVPSAAPRQQQYAMLWLGVAVFAIAFTAAVVMVVLRQR